MATSRSSRKYNQTLTPSPLRRKSFVPQVSDLDADSDLDNQPIDPDDIFGRASAFRKHFSPDSKSSLIKGKLTTPPTPIEDDEGLFLSTATPSRTRPKVTPRVPNSRVKRPTMPPPPTPIAFPVQSSSALPHTVTQTPVKPAPTPKSTASRKPPPATTGTAGVKRKPTPLPVTAPYPKRGMTPLGVTKAAGEGSFGRLAPLPAPKFRNSRSNGETEGLLRSGSATLARLRIDKEDGDAVTGEEEEAVDVSPGGHITKRLARSRPVSQELMDSANASSQSLLQTLSAVKPKPKHKANKSSVTFPTTRSRASSTTPSPLTSPKPRQRTMHASNVSTSSSHSKHEDASSLVRTRKQSISQLRHPPKCISSATLFFDPPVPRDPETSTPIRPRPATMLALDSPGASSTPAHLRPRPTFGQTASASRHSYACPDASFFERAGENRGFAQSFALSSSPISESLPLREAEMGEISDEDGSDFAPVEVDIRALDGGGMEDLFFSSSSFVPSRDIGPDTSFGWDSTPTGISSSLTVNVTESTPSPRSKLAPVACKLEKKYRPRDSGVVLSEDESNNTASNPVQDFVPPAPRHRYTLGRSESVTLTLPRASTSVSTLGSGSDQELITPILGPSTSACWPILTSSSSAASSLGTPDVASVDAFIMRTLMQAARRDEHAPLGGSDVGGSIRPPGTPQKRVKTAMAFSGARPWQSAVASKIGFDFGDEDDDDEARRGTHAGTTKAVKRIKKAPRKSLPAAFPLLSKASRSRGRGAGEGSEDERDGSPVERRSAYDGIGLGRPSAAKAAGASWLLRRSSSGAISNTTSGSGSMSGDGSPTGTAGAIHNWQLPPPRIPPRMSPLKSSIPSHLSSNASDRTASSSSASSTATTTMLASPTTRRLRSQAQSNRQQRRGSSEREMRVSIGSAGGLETTFAQPGRFERDFVEIAEVGSGEFGKVMKVRRQSDLSGTTSIGTGPSPSGDISAVKKSKRFEGVRHRLRLREEVEILQHLSYTYAGVNGPGTRHPNVLAYIDSWEQDDALYIQTELCEFGNFAHFLWEYGRTFPQLDEGRVWKIIADLSNGLCFIHDSGVIHLDIKPANIFITREGRFKIGDFGMASLWPRPVLTSPSAGQEACLRAARTAFEREGDKLYLAPEVLQGQYGKAADMFSFGITILETASNIVVPGEGEPWHRLRHGDLSPADLPTDTSSELRALIAALLSANPEARIDSAAVCVHPVVARTRAAMERLLEEALRAGEQPFAASPLAGVPVGFLEEVLSNRREATTVATNTDASDAMDVGA